MNWFAFLAAFGGFLLSAILCPILIPLLKKLKFGQQVRTEGNPEHLKKQGTPTMGGLAFLPVIAVVGLLFTFLFPEEAPASKTVPVILLTVGFGLVGFTDDYLKVVKKKSEGFKPLQKLLCQLVLTAGFAVYCFLTPEIGDGVLIPFAGGKEWKMGWLYIPFVILAVLGTDNGTNFTDGLDGLLSSVTVVVALCLAYFGLKLGSGITYLSLAAAGALMGFLLSNAYPAKVVMGDTGSLAIGGFVAGAAIVSKAGWFILLFGLIYFVEVLSVVLQVSYFKLTKGKRIFKMAPIHHHFELSGHSETWIVVCFTIVTVFMSIAASLAL
ncbi:MAG: phospho-N-acetylmuramoyl-pentapeptide-transferase [Lachnospiraceae bacterium]|nr:phospho-N-acetylmuramoyl-pentapeptide-transferase [Lachnospiraceae bacterium]